MVLGYNNDDGAQALDQQQEVDYRRGWQVVDAASGSNLVTDGTGAYEVDVAAGDINTPSGTVTCSAATLDLESLVDPDLPRIVIVYRDASGVAQTLAGTPAAKQPTGETSPGPIYQPAPDAFGTTDGVVLATVLLEAAASSVGGAQIRDRRMPASLNVDSAEVGSLNTELTDSNQYGNLSVDAGQYATLQDAIDYAEANNISTVEVPPGDYDPIVVSDDDMSIIGAGIFEADNRTNIEATDGPMVQLNGSYQTISGCRVNVAGGDGDCIQVSGANCFILRNGINGGGGTTGHAVVVSDDFCHVVRNEQISTAPEEEIIFESGTSGGYAVFNTNITTILDNGTNTVRDNS